MKKNTIPPGISAYSAKKIVGTNLVPAILPTSS